MLELGEQCFLALTFSSELDALISKPPPGDIYGNRDWNARVWGLTQAIFSASVIIFRILWPTHSTRMTIEQWEKAKKRGVLLRKQLKLVGKKPTIATSVRNAFEHIDEKLDLWLIGKKGNFPLGSVISSIPEENESEQITKAFRYINVNSRTVRISEYESNLDILIDLLNEIRERLPTNTQMIFERYKAEES